MHFMVHTVPWFMIWYNPVPSMVSDQYLVLWYCLQVSDVHWYISKYVQMIFYLYSCFRIAIGHICTVIDNSYSCLFCRKWDLRISEHYSYDITTFLYLLLLFISQYCLHVSIGLLVFFFHDNVFLPPALDISWAD